MLMLCETSVTGIPCMYVLYSTWLRYLSLSHSTIVLVRWHLTVLQETLFNMPYKYMKCVQMGGVTLKELITLCCCH